MASTLPLASPPSSAPGTNANELKKPFKIRAELLAPTRLAPKAQLLHHNRSRAIQVIAHEVFLLVLACAKCFASADKEDASRIGVLGGGNVGTAVVLTLLANGYRAERIALSTRQPDRIPRCEVLKAPSALPLFQLVPRYYDNARLARESDVLVLCMPPSQIKSVTIQIRHALAANANAPPLVISALCGITQQSLSKACGSQAVVRVRPDVEKISNHWQEQQNQDEDGKAVSQAQSPSSGDVPERDLQPLPLRLASEAIAPQREDVRGLVQAFCLFGHRAWNESSNLEMLTHVLFGETNEDVVAALALGLGKGWTTDEEQQQESKTRAKTPLEVPKWPLEWEQDLRLLQGQLVAHASQ